MTTKKIYRRVLAIAGSDSGGGAGIQADIKAISACGCYAMTAVTALTAQNTLGVTGIHPVPAPFIREQIRVVFDDIGADAVKIGMLHSAEVIGTVAAALSEAGARNIVLDPVMVATSGDRLLEADAVDTLVRDLFPLADLVTPNLPEAELLLGRKLGPETVLEGARELAGLGAASVLLKGGHFDGEELADLFYDSDDDEYSFLRSPRINTNNTHGTGCTLSSAVASFLARGEALAAAVSKGKEYIAGAISAGSRYELGRGHGPVHHFYKFWE